LAEIDGLGTASSGHSIVNLAALVFNDRMNMPTIQPLSYSGYRFPAVIISHGAWLYFRFALTYGDVAEMMAEHGATVSYETIREWSCPLREPTREGQIALAEVVAVGPYRAST
jgi:hypothetical protein